MTYFYPHVTNKGGNTKRSGSLSTLRKVSPETYAHVDKQPTRYSEGLCLVCWLKLAILTK